MFKNKKKMKLTVSIIALAAIGTLMATTAFAAGESGVTLEGGSLSGGNITFADFGSVTLNGSQQTTTAIWSIGNVTDARGTGDGWNLALTLTQLREYDTLGTAYVAGGNTIPASSIQITTAPTVSAADGTSSSADTITVVSNGTALDTGTPVKLLSAALDGGMGSYTVTNMTSTLTVRADAYAGTYKTDATVALVTGP